MRYALMLAAALAIGTLTATETKAQGFNPAAGFGFQPFGFYQPYGAVYGNSLRTPPYFSLNPPVYYGARYARPYGLSPFASPPVTTAPSGYQGRLRSQFIEPQGQYNGPAFRSMPMSNPYIHCRSESATSKQIVKKGEIRSNPYIAAEEAEALVAQK